MGFPAAKLKEGDNRGDGEDGEGVVGGGRSASQPRLPILWFPRFGRSVKEINEVQTRRDLAVNRTVADQETERKVVPFLNSRGQTLFTQSWTPTDPDTNLK